jgi:hypothetical protein
MKLRVLFAGGCHGVGYPFGLDASYTALAVKELERRKLRVEASRLEAYSFRAKYMDQLGESLAEVKPDVVVLQLGHWEIVPGFLEVFRKRVLGQSSRRGSRSSESSESPFDSLGRRIRWQIRATAKALLDAMTGRRLLDEVVLAASLRSAIDLVLGHKIQTVLVMTPFPCSDPTTKWYRQRCQALYERVTHAAGVPVFNSFDALAEEGKTRGQLFHDSIHLSRASHARLGMALGIAIYELVSRSGIQVGGGRRSTPADAVG